MYDAVSTIKGPRFVITSVRVDGIFLDPFPIVYNLLLMICLLSTLVIMIRWCGLCMVLGIILVTLPKKCSGSMVFMWISGSWSGLKGMSLGKLLLWGWLAKAKCSPKTN